MGVAEAGAAQKWAGSATLNYSVAVSNGTEGSRF
jgi:hypothetical protein